MSSEEILRVGIALAFTFYLAVGVFGCIALTLCGLKALLWDVPRTVAAWHRERRWRKEHPPEPSSGWQWYAGAGLWYDVKSKEYADYLRSLGLDVEERGSDKDKEEGRG